MFYIKLLVYSLYMAPMILCIQFRRSESSVTNEQNCISRSLPDSVSCTFVSALDESIVWDEPTQVLSGIGAVILGGSGDFDFDGGRSEDDPDRQMSYILLERLRLVFEHIFLHDIPTLGICYGHQLLGVFKGARVWNDVSQTKSRSHKVQLLANAQHHSVFDGLPKSFHAIYGHKDSLERVPDGAVLLIEGGDQCKVSGLLYQKNILSTQFHPELTFLDMIGRLESSPGYLPEGVLLEEIYKDDADANKILTNFGLFVSSITKK